MVSTHARGHLRDTALLHVVERVVYLAALAAVTPQCGVVGAAVLWSGRALLDTGGLVFIWRRHLDAGIQVRLDADRARIPNTP